MLKFAANISLLFTERPLLERFAAARAAGFDAVEVQFPYEESATALARAVQAAGVCVVLVNAPVGPETSTLGLACVEGAGGLFRSELARGLEYAQALGAPRINVLAGRTPPAARPQALERLAEGLALAAEMYGPKGIVPLLEPMNPVDRPDYCVTDFDGAAAVLRRTDPRVRLQFDVYHAARMGLDPAAAWRQHGDRAGHVQIADSPGRHEPGTGAIDWKSVFGALRSGPRVQWIGAEYVPLRATADGLGWLAAWTGKETANNSNPA